MYRSDDLTADEAVTNDGVGAQHAPPAPEAPAPVPTPPRWEPSPFAAPSAETPRGAVVVTPPPAPLA